jgi:hypothetical protein
MQGGLWESWHILETADELQFYDGWLSCYYQRNLAVVPLVRNPFTIFTHVFVDYFLSDIC